MAHAVFGYLPMLNIFWLWEVTWQLLVLALLVKISRRPRRER